MSGNAYVLGAMALASKSGEEIGYSSLDWTTLFYDPAGGLYRYLNQGPDPNYSQGSAQNIYWAKQRVAANPLAQGVVQNQQAAQQLQQTLRQQQAAMYAALQQRAAAAGVTLNQPTPPPGAPSPFPSAVPDASTDAAVPDGSGDGVVVGATTADQFLVIKLKDVGSVVKEKGGTLGNLAFGLAPQTIANTVYDQMKQQFAQKLAEQGVAADVTVTGSAPSGPRPKAEFLRGLGFGAGAVGLGWLLRSWLKKR